MAEDVSGVEGGCPYSFAEDSFCDVQPSHRDSSPSGANGASSSSSSSSSAAVKDTAGDISLSHVEFCDTGAAGEGGEGDGTEDSFAYEVTCLSFNQDHSCLAVGTRRGFIIYGCDPPPFQKFYEERCNFSVGIISMFYNSCLIALVPSPDETCPPLWRSNEEAAGGEEGTSLTRGPSSCRQLIMWHVTNRCEILRFSFEQPIKAVRMNRKRVVVLLCKKIYVLNMKDMKVIHQMDRMAHTWVDPSLCALVTSGDWGYMATPCLCEPPSGLVTLIDTFSLKPIGSVLAHTTAVQALAFNSSGSLLATASVKGTVVRVFSVPLLERLYQFRRGASETSIFSLSFTRNSDFLTASAASGTIHMFRIQNGGTSGVNGNGGAASGVSGSGGAGCGVPVVASSASSSSSSLSLSGATFPAVADISRVFLSLPSLSQAVSTDLRSALASSAASLTRSVGAAVGRSVASVAKHPASSYVMGCVPVQCRDWLDSHRAFAFAKLRTAPGQRTAAAVFPRPASGRLEVLVASRAGTALVFECPMNTGGECRLRAEHALCFGEDETALVFLHRRLDEQRALCLRD
uniref:BCAS3 domain-containing protein n=1 Tax=Chromera velia CCMP2878 TaxID=1169474 RepID=A0A0G4H8G4_9ALVE|eukprot:Cvel_5886.t1-p1 / transcript=Cvel_5886.t1 / gene=Cvel_5886 / organism=Chromera_velia_CCMP2878 / gene_product=Autophagy-related protein 18, putative / transcript_product=Autophagy-related protein 18, putative / location=Cvel_scaffold280:67065-70197(-) / protein_length=572 / sequence_SO=supercontig / SO=protein_coding / is_pseudo=false